MWFLTNNKTQQVYYMVAQPTGYTVGRTSTDLIITGDESISRNHAMLQPYNDVLNVTDTGSRYGSYVNDNIAKTVPISKEKATALKPGDKIRFGRCGSIWQVGKMDFRCLTSTLIMNGELKTILDKIGAKLVSSYTEDLTHLIMPTITITTKFLQCLVGQVPIVKPEFFQAIDRDCIGNGKALPSVKDFIPACTEPYLRNDPQLFHPNSSRSHLFKGKEFIFFNTAQFGQFEQIVKIAGGVCLCAKREKIAKSRFIQPNVIAVKLNSSGSTQSQSFDTLSQYVTSHGRRMVPDMEIGLALIFCSTEKYCNPGYSFAFNIEECYSSVEGCDTLAKSTEQATEKTDARAANVTEIQTIPETETYNEAKQRDTASSSKTNTMSTRSGSAFLVPKVVSPKKMVTVERRQSKRMQEALSRNEDLSCNLPKRPRRNATPVDSVSFSPVLDSKLTEPEPPALSEFQISETQPTPLPPCHTAVAPLQARGFRAVNRVPMDLRDRTAKEPPKARQAANLDINLDDDEMLMFDDLAPRKKPRVEKTSSTSSTVPVCNNRNTPAKEADLFSFDEMPSTQQRRTANQHKAKQTVALDAPTNSLSKSSTVDSEVSLSRPVGLQNRNASNASTLHSYREFIKAVQPCKMGWLSSTMCGLKVTENDKEHSFDQMKIKSEPLDEIDDPHGMLSDSKNWKSMEMYAISVREISMNLVARRPINVSRQDDCNNFKAFVKKRNYIPQKHVLPTKSFCLRDDIQYP